jgi:hypothetical protein
MTVRVGGGEGRRPVRSRSRTWGIVSSIRKSIEDGVVGIGELGLPRDSGHVLRVSGAEWRPQELALLSVVLGAGTELSPHGDEVLPAFRARRLRRGHKIRDVHEAFGLHALLGARAPRPGPGGPGGGLESLLHTGGQGEVLEVTGELELGCDRFSDEASPVQKPFPQSVGPSFRRLDWEGRSRRGVEGATTASTSSPR